MPRIPDGLVVSSWCKPFDFFQASAKEVYSAVETGVARRQVPGAKASRVVFREGSVFGAGREYLRFERKGQRIDLCAAPFGTGYFFSWWQTEPTSSWRLLYLLVILAGAAGLATTLIQKYGLIFGPIVAVGALLVIGWLLGAAIRRGWIGIEQDILMIPVVGRLYTWVFKPTTYYRIDTARMFQAAVHSAFLEVIDGLTAAKGIRAMSEAERKPIMKQFGEMPADVAYARDDRGGAPAHTA